MTNAAWDPLAGRPLNAPPDGHRLRDGWARRDALAADLLLRAVQEMGAFIVPDERHRTDELASRLGIVTAHRRLWDVLLDHLAEAGFLDRDEDEIRTTEAVTEVPKRDAAEAVTAYLAEHPEMTAHVELLRTCVGEYPRLLRGETKPTSVLFARGSMDKLESVYRDEPISNRLNELVAETVATRLANGDAGARRVLEVGAGTGGTTVEIFKSLARDPAGIHYTFTDLSTTFTRAARSRFADQVFEIDYRRLDIESDPEAQSFADDGYDVVVAANVLHATRDVSAAVANAARLLRPGGWLVLRELTGRTVYNTMIFGLLSGWWHFVDPELRMPGSPVVDLPTWTRVLTGAGFRRVAVLAPTASHASQFGQHVLVAS